ncbi:MAG TPA: TonB-dependent receptor [Chitinophagales bacterium]|nr:TonB-dependent receptor [Chitinophagales bacterium]
MKYSVRSFSFHLVSSLSLIFVLSHSGVNAQPATAMVKGTVTTSSGEKLDAAGVFLKDTRYNALTTSDGVFLLKSVTPGKYHLVCSYLGYKQFEKDITVNDAEVLQLKIVMEPDAHLLDEAVIIGQKEVNTVKRMPETEGTMIYAAKRNDVIQMDRQNSNIAQVVTRQIFAKVPGVTIWDFDGSGNQVNVATRGLNPHRSIEMNVRQDGYCINSDLFGYPEAHYAPAMAGVQKIEFIRGSASLQYGPQFGGLLNYIMREGDANKKFTYTTQETIGSDALISTFNSIGGTVGKWNYYSYFNYRRSDGYRPNSEYFNYQYYASLGYRFSEKLSARLEFSRMYYVDQLAGGLTDSMFNEDPYQSTRSRNYFQPNFNIPALTLNLRLTENTSISLVSNYLIGERNSVMFIAPPAIADTINATTLQYAPRQVDLDSYNSFASEARLLQRYKFLKQTSVLSIGIRYSDNKTHRQQRGVGTTGTGFDLSISSPYSASSAYPIDLVFTTFNYAVFAENVFHLGENFSITPGIRLDVLKTTSDGLVNYLPDGVPYDRVRNILTAGCGAQYNFSNHLNVYANFSQAYKPILYSDLVPSATLDIVDPDITDSHGYQADLGIRGSIKDVLRFDAGLYYLYYADRVGTITLKDSAGNNYNYRTNTGTTEAKGLEAFVEFHPLNLAGGTAIGDISIFSSTSTDHAIYIKGNVVANGENIDIKGNKLENAPDLISRSGITWSYKKVSLTAQYSYTSSIYSDASNAESSSNAITGIVPAYGIFDLSGVIDFGKFSLTGGINNLTDKKYFTRRINTYPGPGILPGDGRTGYLSFGAKF